MNVNRLRKLANRRRQQGQGMTEYIIIIAVVAVLSIVMVTAFGDQVRDMFKVSGERLTGDKSAKMDKHTDSEDAEQDLKSLAE